MSAAADRVTAVTPATLRDWALPAPGSGKDARGQLLVLGGSSGTPGAVLLAGESALRAGAGKLAIATARDVAAPLAVAVPESAVLALPCSDAGDILPSAAPAVLDRATSVDVLIAGPGFADPDAAVALLSAVLPEVTCPVVVDALGSAYLTEHPDGLHHLEGRAVLTVNPSELAHTAGCEVEEVEDDPLTPALQVAERSRVVVLVGGSTKRIVTPDGDVWSVEGGGPGLGVSGSGDTQAGIVGGLLARGAEPAQAAVWGAYLHARAGERLGAEVGMVGYLAREIPPHVPRILSELQI